MKDFGKRKDMVGQTKRHCGRTGLIFLLALRLWQQLAQTAMRSDPIVDRQRSPSGREFCVRFTGEGQGLTRLDRTHQPGGAVATFDGGGVGYLVS